MLHALVAALPWIMAAALVLLPVILRIWAEDDNLGNSFEHHHDDPPDTGDGEDGRPALLAA